MFWLPDQLARCHTRGRDPSDPVLIIGAWKQKRFSPLLKPCKICRISCSIPWHLLRWQLIGSANVSTLMQPMRSLISWLMHTLLSSVNEHLHWNSQSLEHGNPRRFRYLQWTLLWNVWWGRKHPLRNIFHLFFILPIQLTETKFIISGRFERANGHVMRDELAYISETKQQAINTCQRLNPDFHIHTVRVDDTMPEIVRPQRLI